MSPEEEEGFLSRWSRRKRTAPDEDAAPAPAPEPEPAPQPEAVATPALSEEELAALPKIEDLAPGSDIRAFLRPGVPASLKNAALRKMWLLTPAIRDYRDPAVDYAWDWNTPGGVPGDGVGPSAERAAQMMRDLLAPRRAPVTDQPAPEAAQPQARTDVDPAPDVPQQDQTQSQADMTQGTDNPLQPDSETPMTQETVRPRHGGALPT
jgi:hypothetical protein